MSGFNVLRCRAIWERHAYPSKFHLSEFLWWDLSGAYHSVSSVWNIVEATLSERKPTRDMRMILCIYMPFKCPSKFVSFRIALNLWKTIPIKSVNASVAGVLPTATAKKHDGIPVHPSVYLIKYAVVCKSLANIPHPPYLCCTYVFCHGYWQNKKSTFTHIADFCQRNAK